jgi:predicted phosphodiesterase
MRYAIISDIHANLEALTAVLERIDSDLATDQIICSGDLVGYYANPNECLRLIRERGIQCIAGNHDTVAAGLKEPLRFGMSGRNAILWTRQQLTPDNLRFLQSLPLTLTIDEKILVVHGSLHPQPNEDNYLNTPEQIKACFAAWPQTDSPLRLCFFGHTHRALAYESSGEVVRKHKTQKLKLQDDATYLVNPGSVGQPRDRDRRAAFAVFDDETRTLEFHRVEFDREACYRKAEAAGLILRETYLSRAENVVRGWIETGADLLERARGNTL